MPILTSQDCTLAQARSQTTILLDRIAGWEVYRRLQALDIPCQYSAHQPLTVTADTPMAIAQVWSVVKAVTTPKAELANHLNRCWHHRISP